MNKERNKGKKNKKQRERSKVPIVTIVSDKTHDAPDGILPVLWNYE